MTMSVVWKSVYNTSAAQIVSRRQFTITHENEIQKKTVNLHTNETDEEF